MCLKSLPHVCELVRPRKLKLSCKTNAGDKEGSIPAQHPAEKPCKWILPCFSPCQCSQSGWAAEPWVLLSEEICLSWAGRRKPKHWSKTRNRTRTHYFLLRKLVNSLVGFSGISAAKESSCNTGDHGLIPGSGRSPGEGIGYPLQYFGASLVVMTVKNPPAMQKTWIRSLGWENILEEGMATHSSSLSSRIPTDRGAWRAAIHGVAKELDTTERLSTAHSSELT